MRTFAISAVALAALLALAAVAPAADYKGWEKGSTYDKQFNPLEMDKLKGYFQDTFEITPMPGMEPGIGVVMRDKADGEIVRAILGPKSYVAEGLRKLQLKKDQQIKIYGAWIEVEGEDYIMATKVKKTEDQFLKVRRTSDGLPYWTMTPEQVEKELAGVDTE